MLYDLTNMDRTAAFYSQPTYVQRGSGLPVYSGSRRQRGGSVLGALKGFVMPALNTLKKNAVKRMKSEAWNLTKGVVGDAFRGKNIGQAFKNRGIESVKRLGKGVLIDTANSVIGSASSKRKAPAIKRPPAKKRRRRNF